MTTENQGYIIDVIADLQKRLASEASSNEYLRSSNKELVEKINSLNEVSRQSYINTENLNAKIADLKTDIDAYRDIIDYQNNQIAEQKETIETLQSTIQSMDINYDSLDTSYKVLDASYQLLVEKYNALNPANNGSN
jgi:chromosome segregation ATPase